tara:strand:+ start:125 stop:343 length:219 start_codon:yes stop_codon:yes gene_type:complete
MFHQKLREDRMIPNDEVGIQQFNKAHDKVIEILKKLSKAYQDSNEEEALKIVNEITSWKVAHEDSKELSNNN